VCEGEWPATDASPSVVNKMGRRRSGRSEGGWVSRTIQDTRHWAENREESGE